MQEIELPEFSQFIQGRLNIIRTKNKSYSIRAFARDCEMSASRLSEILRGKGTINKNSILKISRALNLSDNEVEYLDLLVKKESTNLNKKLLAESMLVKSDYKSLDMNNYSVIADPIHFAILTAMEIDKFDGSVTFLSNILNKPNILIKNALKRLLKLNLVELNDNKYILSQKGVMTSDGITSKALKTSHKKNLENSIKVLDEISVDLRDISSMFMAIDEDKIDDAKKMIKDFRRKMCKFLETGNKKQVYQLNIQLVPYNGEGGK